MKAESTGGPGAAQGASTPPFQLSTASASRASPDSPALTAHNVKQEIVSLLNEIVSPGAGGTARQEAVSASGRGRRRLLYPCSNSMPKLSAFAPFLALQLVRRHFAVHARLSHPFGYAVGSAQAACMLTCMYLWRRWAATVWLIGCPVRVMGDVGCCCNAHHTVFRRPPLARYLSQPSQNCTTPPSPAYCFPRWTSCPSACCLTQTASRQRSTWRACCACAGWAGGCRCWPSSLLSWRRGGSMALRLASCASRSERLVWWAWWAVHVAVGGWVMLVCIQGEWAGADTSTALHHCTQLACASSLPLAAGTSTTA